MFIWWASQAMKKFWIQPLVTDMITSFGDNGNGIQYPRITFCSENYEYHKTCNIIDGSSYSHFNHKIVKCLMNDKDFKIDTFLENLPDERKTVFDMVRLWDGSEYIDLQYLEDQIWSKVFHQKWGPCFTFDLSRKKEFEYVPYKGISSPGIEFYLAENNPWSKFRIMLHSANDLPDSEILNGEITFTINDTQTAHVLDIRKTISKRESTRKVPCTEYEQNTCLNIEDNRLILEQFNCKIPILYNGKHLDEFIPKETLNCTNEVTTEAFHLLVNKKSNCTKALTCEMKRFVSNHMVKNSWHSNSSVVWIAFANPEVIYYNSYISYDLFSLIGEVGGTLGLTLGASVMTLLESMFQKIPYY